MTLKEITENYPNLSANEQIKLYKTNLFERYDSMVKQQIELLNNSKYLKITKGDYYLAYIHVKSFEIVNNDFGSKSIKFSGEKIEIISNKKRKLNFENKWLDDLKGMSTISKEEYEKTSK
jgi:hypothetical protein